MIFTAFSYSDKNFTVIGNLCFAHICLPKGDGSVAIPPAIADRMLINDFRSVYVAVSTDGSSWGNSTCSVTRGNVIYTNPKDNAYLNFCFPIDSNK